MMENIKKIKTMHLVVSKLQYKYNCIYTIDIIVIIMIIL
jgi:hypothetical protein